MDNYSLEHQERELLDYCQRYSVEVTGIYRDAGVSGSTITDRPAIRSLVRDAEVKKFSEVLIYKLDRFTRADPWDLYPLVKGLMDLNVKIQSTTEAFDLSDDNGQLIFSILANFAARERRLIVERTLSGKRDRAREGKFTGGAVPFGYTVDPETGRYLPDETIWWRDTTKADLVRLIFEKYLEFQGTKGVMTWLIRNGVPAARTQWNPASIAQILRNPVYTGRFAWGKRSHRMHQRSQVHRPSEWITIESAHPALIDMGTWERCLLQRQEMRRGGRTPNEPRRLLDGLLVCPHCGSALTPRENSNGTYYYTCASRFNAARRRDGTACEGTRNWRGEQLTNLIWGQVTEIIMSGKLLEIANSKEGDRDSLLQQADSRVSAARRQLQEVDRKEEQLLELTLAGRFSAQSLDKKQAALEKERAALTAELHEAEEGLRKAKASTLTAADLKTLQAEVRELLHDDAPPEARRRFLTFWLAEKIVVQDNGTVTIAFRTSKEGREAGYKLKSPLRRARSPATR